MKKRLAKDLSAAVRHAAEIDEIGSLVRERLAEEHITAVLSDVVGGDTSLAPSDLARIGFPADIAACFPDQANAERFCYNPALGGFRLRPESTAHSLDRVRLNMPSAAEGVSLTLRLMRDLLNADSGIGICLMARPGTQSQQLGALVERWGHDPVRVQSYAHHVSTFFAQDDGLSGTTEDGTPALLLPRHVPEPFDDPDEDLESLSEQLEIPVVRSRLFWEGGNVLCDGERCLVGANTIAINRRRLGLTEDQVVEAFAAEFGYEITVLGDCAESLRVLADPLGQSEFQVEGGQADFHIDLDIALLGPRGEDRAPLAAIADCGLWTDHLDEILGSEKLFEDHFLPPQEMKEIFVANLRATMSRREAYLEAYRARLSAAGYRLLSIPDIRLAPTYDYLGRENFRYNYVNVLPALRANGEPSVLGFQFGFPRLDSCAAEVYRHAGIAFHPLNRDSAAAANEAYRRHGGVHCLLSKMI